MPRRSRQSHRNRQVERPTNTGAPLIEAAKEHWTKLLQAVNDAVILKNSEIGQIFCPLVAASLCRALFDLKPGKDFSTIECLFLSSIMLIFIISVHFGVVSRATSAPIFAANINNLLKSTTKFSNNIERHCELLVDRLHEHHRTNLIKASNLSMMQAPLGLFACLVAHQWSVFAGHITIVPISSTFILLVYSLLLAIKLPSLFDLPSVHSVHM